MKSFNAISRARSLRNKAQRGMTLIELTLVLVVGGLIIFGALSQFRSTNQSGQVSNEAKAAQAIIAGVRSLYPGLSTYTGLSEAQLISANKVPTSMVHGTALKHSWNGAVTVAPNGTAGFDITYAAVPSASCIEFVSSIAAGFNTVKVGATTVKATNAALDSAATTTACTAASTASIVFNTI